jgi:hypothetical protein
MVTLQTMVQQVAVCTASWGTYEHSQKMPFGNTSGVYGRVCRRCDRLRLDKGRGSTTRGHRYSASSRRSGSQPATRTTPWVCETGELLGQGEDCPDICA